MVGGAVVLLVVIVAGRERPFLFTLCDEGKRPRPNVVSFALRAGHHPAAKRSREAVE
jgi:hypothetical protein